MGGHFGLKSSHFILNKLTLRDVKSESQRQVGQWLVTADAVRLSVYCSASLQQLESTPMKWNDFNSHTSQLPPPSPLKKTDTSKEKVLNAGQSGRATKNTKSFSKRRWPRLVKQNQGLELKTGGIGGGDTLSPRLLSKTSSWCIYWAFWGFNVPREVLGWESFRVQCMCEIIHDMIKCKCNNGTYSNLQRSKRSWEIHLS